MRILASIHLYPPTHNCGGEYYLHNILKHLALQGHECRVIVHQVWDETVVYPYIYEGVEVFGPTGDLNAYLWSDIIITHLDYTQYSIIMSCAVKKPIIHISHNDISYASIENSFANTSVIYNSEWVGKSLNYKHRSMVFPPSIDYQKIITDNDPIKNNFITLINMNRNKGGAVLYKIAKAMPHKQFLGVLGSYDHQFVRPLPNLTVIANTPDIKDAYSQTRILLMPSFYESWGMTATEAMANGIPVICTQTPGLKENCADAGIYIKKRWDIKKWVAEINKLDNEIYYKEKSNLCKIRSESLKPNFKKLENFILKTIKK